MFTELDLTGVDVDILHQPSPVPFKAGAFMTLINIHNCHPLFSKIIEFVAKANFETKGAANFLRYDNRFNMRVSLDERTANHINLHALENIKLVLFSYKGSGMVGVSAKLEMLSKELKLEIKGE